MEKQLLIKLAKEPDTVSINKAYSDFLDILSSALDDLNQNLKYLTPDKTKIFPIGESANNTFIDEIGTDIDILIAINDPQLELSNNALKDFYKEIKRKKNKRNKENIAIKTRETSQEIIMGLFKELIGYFSSTTRLMINNLGIKIFAIQEMGYNFQIRIATVDTQNENYIFKIWNPIDYNTNDFDVFEYSEKLEEKDILTKGNLFKLIRIIKSLRKSLILNKQISPNLINRYGVELLCYNIPNDLLYGEDIYTVLTKSINYLSNIPYSNLTNFDQKTPIDKFSLVNINATKIIVFIDKIKKLAFKKQS